MALITNIFITNKRHGHELAQNVLSLILTGDTRKIFVSNIQDR